MKQTKKCATCWWGLLREEQQLKTWLVEQLGAEFRYQWSLRDELGREEPGIIHPDAYRRWLEQGPCVGCPCEPMCNQVCHLRARWWDARMERVRKCMDLAGDR